MRYIERMTDELKSKYETDDPFEIADNMKITVSFSDLPESVRGFYFRVGKYKIICINNELDYDERKVTCAHELGHAVLHDDMNVVFMTQNTNMAIEKYEREADYFCACLLIGKSDFRKLCEGREQLTVSQISAITHLPERIVMLRLETEQ